MGAPARHPGVKVKHLVHFLGIKISSCIFEWLLKQLNAVKGMGLRQWVGQRRGGGFAFRRFDELSQLFPTYRDLSPLDKVRWIFESFAQPPARCLPVCLTTRPPTARLPAGLLACPHVRLPTARPAFRPSGRTFPDIFGLFRTFFGLGGVANQVICNDFQCFR